MRTTPPSLASRMIRAGLVTRMCQPKHGMRTAVYHMPPFQYSSTESDTRRTEPSMLCIFHCCCMIARPMHPHTHLHCSRPIRCCQIYHRSRSRRPMQCWKRPRSTTSSPPHHHGHAQTPWVLVTGQDHARMHQAYHHRRACSAAAQPVGHPGSPATKAQSAPFCRVRCP